jgi:polyisoprenoid-binding protein YceI
MKKVMFILFLATAASAISCKGDKPKQADEAAAIKEDAAEAVVYNVDTAATVIKWTGSKQTGAHHGLVKLLTGTVYVKDNKLDSGHFTINMSSIQTTDVKPEDGKAELEAHLKGTNMDKEADHFFNVRKYPEGKFELTGVKDENGKTMIAGNLTLKATTKNVEFPATVNVSDNEVTIDSEPFTIDRTQWNINYGSKKSIMKDLTDNFINDEVDLQVHLKATK